MGNEAKFDIDDVSEWLVNPNRRNSSRARAIVLGVWKAREHWHNMWSRVRITQMAPLLMSCFAAWTTPRRPNIVTCNEEEEQAPMWSKVPPMPKSDRASCREMRKKSRRRDKKKCPLLWD